MVSSLERSFFDQCVRHHASGGDLDALVKVTRDGDGGVHIEDGLLGATRLFCAAREGWSSAVAWLLQRGADVQLGCPALRWAPLHTATDRGRNNAAVLLLDAGARVDDRDWNGLTALHLAINANRFKMCKLLLGRGASLDARGDAGARLDDRDWNGMTALHFAAANNHPKMCKLLLSRGASLDARSTKGRDPEANARRFGYTTLADFLAAVRAAGGWTAHVAARRADRAELLAFRRALPTLRRSGPCAARAQARLFLDAKVPDDVFVLVLQFWRSERDY